MESVREADAAGSVPAFPTTSLQSRLEGDQPGGDDADGGADPAPPYPIAALSVLEAGGRFHRDTGLGRIFHPGSVSLRENRLTDSLHVVVHDDRVTAHVDRVSPLVGHAHNPTRYSVSRAAAHNVAGMAQDLIRLLRGRKGDHRSRLDCEWMWSPDDAAPRPADLLDPASGSWSVQLEVRVGGRLDESRLRTALATALGRRPPTHELLVVVEPPADLSLAAVRARLHGEPAPLRAWPPVRTALARHPDGDVLLLSVNHAAGDGQAALSVLRAVAGAYRGDTGDRLRPDFVALSDLPVRPASAPVSRLLATQRRLVEGLRDSLARPARLAPDQAEDQPGFGFHLRQLTVEETRRVINVSRPGTGRNVLLAGLHLAIGHWNLRHGTPGRRIGVLLPVDLRPPGWPEETIGNFSVTARVSTSRRHRAGPRTALGEVRSQKMRNKRVRTGIALLEGLQRSGLLPLWGKQSLVVLQPLTGNRLLDTALFADLGWIDDPPSFGDGAEVVDVWFSAPARTPDSLCIGAVTVGGRLHLSFRYSHRLFSADAARRFADLYLAQIRLVAESR